jgi:hypothetical protein
MLPGNGQPATVAPSHPAHDEINGEDTNMVFAFRSGYPRGKPHGITPETSRTPKHSLYVLAASIRVLNPRENKTSKIIERRSRTNG